MSEKKRVKVRKIKVRKKGNIKIKKQKKKTISQYDCATLEEKYIDMKQSDIDLNNSEHKELLKCMMYKNKQAISRDESFEFLYPTLNDPEFIYKIAKKK